MELTQPEDFRILEALHSYGRNVGPNIATIADLETDFVIDRLGVLSDLELVSMIGPADESGLFEITDRGRVALRLRDEYGTVEDFETLIDQHAAVNDTGAATAIVRGRRDDE